MFERYTESARRALFFARYEASQLSHTSIESVHLLLGVLRAGTGVTGKLLRLANISYEPVLAKVDRGPGKPLSTSVEIPFTAETKRVLDHTAEEADRLGHSYIGTEHLLLGLLREDRSAAGRILGGYGMQVESVRAQLVDLLQSASVIQEDPSSGLAEGVVRLLDRHDRIDRIRDLVDRLEQAAPGSPEALNLIDLIRQALDTL